MGTFYQAKDMKRQGVLCVIKERSLSTVPPEDQALAIKNFKTEAKMLSVLSHPYLPTFTHFFAENQRYFLVMEDIDGTPLEELLDLNHGPFSEQRVLSWAEQLCDVLEYLHSQNPPIIFRNMKPSKVMLTRQGHIKLIDFSIARFFRPTNEPDTQLLGTPGYAPPEQYSSTTQTDERSDIYALGMSLHQLLTNTFSDTGFGVKAKEMRATNPQVSISVARALEKATALEPSDRYESVAAFRHALLGVRAFIFETGESASEADTLAQLCANYPEEASKYLASGQIASWLQEIGEADLSELAWHIHETRPDPQQAVEQFVHAILGQRSSSSSPIRTPIYGTSVTVRPKTLNFGAVYPPGVSAPLKIAIDNEQNRRVKGTIRASAFWIRLDRTEFDGMSTYVNVQIRSAQLNSYTPYRGEVIISPEGGIPVTVVVSADIQGYTSQARRPAKTISPEDDDEDELLEDLEQARIIREHAQEEQAKPSFARNLLNNAESLVQRLRIGPRSERRRAIEAELDEAERQAVIVAQQIEAREQQLAAMETAQRNRANHNLVSEQPPVATQQQGLQDKQEEKTPHLVLPEQPTVTTQQQDLQDKQEEKTPQPVFGEGPMLAYGISVNVSSKEVPIGGEVEVALSLGPADGDETYLLEVPQDEMSGLELNVLLTAPHFHINGENARSLPLDLATAQDVDVNKIHAQTVLFALTALRSGPLKIELDLYANDAFRTHLEYTVQVARIDQSDSFSINNLTQPRPVRHPDLILQVARNDTGTNNAIDTCTFHYHLTSSCKITQIPEQGIEYRSAQFPADWLEQVYALLRHTLESTEGAQVADRHTRLALLGQYLFRSLLPTRLQRTLRSLVDVGHTLLILSDQNAIFPWTLLHDGQAFLGEHFSIGRWLRELHDIRPYEFPVSTVSIAYYEGITKPEIWTEALTAAGTPAAKLLPGGLLQNVGKTESIRGLHLLRMGKSSHVTDLRDAPALHAEMPGEGSIEQQVQVAKFSLRSNHPLVTLSYLHAGRSEITALEQSWSSTFIRAGCSAFIGPLWAVQPTVEATFVSTFYARLWAGDTLGDAFRSARELTRMAVPNSVDHLAYVLFGDPMARPYRPVEGNGYATVEPVGRKQEDPVSPGTSVRFRVSLRRRPPIWHEGRVIEVAQELNFEHLKIYVVTFGLQVTPATPVTLRHASTGDYFGWFSLKVPIDSQRTSSMVQVHFVDAPDASEVGIDELEPIHSLRFTLPITGSEGEIPSKSEPIGMDKMNAPLEIVIDTEHYNLGHSQYNRTASDTTLESFTQKILQVFRVLEREVNSREAITLPEEVCHKQLVELAHQGMVAYRKFFKDQRALNHLNKSMAKWNLVPTFVSALMPFPWEILYEGDDNTQGDPKMFWGLRYTPARILKPEMDIHDYPEEQALPLDMLFCLHHDLVQSHQQEQPAIEQLVRKTLSKNRFSVLGGTGCDLTKLAGPDTSGKLLLQYLDTSKHNIVHFACHCGRDSHDDTDTLLLSLVNDEQVKGDVPAIYLKTDDFDLVTGKFQYRPLVFLNACQSASGVPDELGKTFNLPTAFIEHEAAAVIATICPIPDLFAAAFARVFYEHFLDQQMTIGDALRTTRWYFLEKHNNPLGLAYGLYSPAHFRLARPPVEG